MIKLKSTYKKSKTKPSRTIFNHSDNIGDETWLVIEDYPDYMVSSKGRVKSFKGSVPKILSTAFCRNGYEKLNLRNENGSKNFTMHRVVAMAFCDNPNGKKEVNHIDGNKSNNCCTNLKWVSRKENMRHAVETGLKIGLKGEKCANSKLNDLEVLTIKTLLSVGEYTNVEIGETVGASASTVCAIKRKKSWRHIPDCSREEILTQCANEVFG